MSTHSTPAVLPLALAAGAMVLTAAACGGGDGQGGSTTAPTATVTATETATTTASASSTPSPAASGTASPSGDPTAGGTCSASSLRVRYADDRGGAGAGSVAGTFTFTNTGSASCALRGFPGVSYVTGSKGTQVGQPASRTDDDVSTKTLKAGGSATAALRRSQPRNYGGSCQETDVSGFRVYPPGSTAAVFVTFPTTGCKSTAAPLLQVGPVR